MENRTKTNINFILSGVCFLAISAVLGWLFNTLVFMLVEDADFFIYLTLIGMVLYFVPVTLLNRYGFKVMKGDVHYFKVLNKQQQTFTTFVLIVLSILISLIFFAGQFMEGFSEGITQGSIIGYIVVMVVSYITVLVIDFFKKHPLQGDQ